MLIYGAVILTHDPLQSPRIFFHPWLFTLIFQRPKDFQRLKFIPNASVSWGKILFGHIFSELIRPRCDSAVRWSDISPPLQWADQKYTLSASYPGIDSPTGCSPRHIWTDQWYASSWCFFPDALMSWSEIHFTFDCSKSRVEIQFTTEYLLSWHALRPTLQWAELRYTSPLTLQ